jgi:acyl-CoA dehydrogenase
MQDTASPHEASIRDAVARLCAPFDDAYWLAKDRDGGFPEDFYRAFATAGWLGICIPQDYGGAELGITEAAIMMQAVARSGAGLSGASADGPHAAAARGRPRQGVLCGDRA